MMLFRREEAAPPARLYHEGTLSRFYAGWLYSTDGFLGNSWRQETVRVYVGGKVEILRGSKVVDSFDADSDTKFQKLLPEEIHLNQFCFRVYTKNLSTLYPYSFTFRCENEKEVELWEYKMTNLLHNLVEADMTMLAFTRKMGFDQNLKPVKPNKNKGRKNKSNKPPPNSNSMSEESGWEEITGAAGKVVYRNRATAEYKDCYPVDTDTTNPCRLRILPSHTHYAIDLEKAGYDSERSGEVLATILTNLMRNLSYPGSRGGGVEEEEAWDGEGERPPPSMQVSAGVKKSERKYLYKFCRKIHKREIIFRPYSTSTARSNYLNGMFYRVFSEEGSLVVEYDRAHLWINLENIGTDFMNLASHGDWVPAGEDKVEDELESEEEVSDDEEEEEDDEEEVEEEGVGEEKVGNTQSGSNKSVHSSSKSKESDEDGDEDENDIFSDTHSSSHRGSRSGSEHTMVSEAEADSPFRTAEPSKTDSKTTSTGSTITGTNGVGLGLDDVKMTLEGSEEGEGKKEGVSPIKPPKPESQPQPQPVSSPSKPPKPT